MRIARCESAEPPEILYERCLTEEADGLRAMKQDPDSGCCCDSFYYREEGPAASSLLFAACADTITHLRIG